MSLGIWDHTVLPAIRHKWTHPVLTPARGRYSIKSIYLLRRDGWKEGRNTQNSHTKIFWETNDGVAYTCGEESWKMLAYKWWTDKGIPLSWYRTSDGRMRAHNYSTEPVKNNFEALWSLENACEQFKRGAFTVSDTSIPFDNLYSP